jgi:hypothetical protein
MRLKKAIALIGAMSLTLTGLSVLGTTPAEAAVSCEASGNSATTQTGNVVVIKFTAASNGTNGSCTWTVPDNVYVVDYLVVAGGGGGGSGGGGGGRVVYSDNPQTVTPGNSIAITVGRGGMGGWGGNSSSQSIVYPTSGGNSVFGSITAVGGGAGGSWNRFVTPNTGSANGNGSVGGSSGGDAYDASTSSGQTASGVVVVGATSLGNAGGGSPSGSYSAGGGGGGANSSGGNAERNATRSALTSNGCAAQVDITRYNYSCISNYYGGGNGGSGYTTSISGSSTCYGAGGGGGVNSNRGETVAGGSGSSGCGGNDGKGSSCGYASSVAGTCTSNATSGASSTGNGGGGTDPEDSGGGNGGSGVVIVKYTLVDSNCPNNGTNSATSPLACPASLTVQADGGTSNVSVLGSPISFSSNGTLSVRSRPAANPTSGNMSATASGSSIAISVPSGSSLIGGTYPVVYRITQGGSTSDSYILVTVEDPAQLTPGTIPLDPRESGITFPRVELGSSPNVLVCLTLQDNNTDQLSLAAGTTAGVTIANPTSRRITFSGSNSSVESALNAVTLTATANNVLVTNTATRVLDVNVTNTDNGGNGSCSVGTSSTITLKKLGLTTGQRTKIELR